MFAPGNYVLCFSILLIIAGASMAFSQRERERTQKRVMQELPERASLVGSPEALREAKRRGYITLVIGLILLVAWFCVFGKISV